MNWFNYNHDEKLEALAKRLALVGDSQRLKILCLIFNKKKLCVSEIAQELNMSVATASHHLQALADDGFFKSERNGKKVCYSMVKNSFSNDLKHLICKYK